MSYVLEAVLGHIDVVGPAARGLGGACVELAFELGLVPMTGAIHEALGKDPVLSARELPPTEGFRNLSPPLMAWLEQLSAPGPVAYVEAVFLERPGTQACVVWSRGRPVLGPLGHHRGLEQMAMRDWPINQALRFLGVTRSGNKDEFERLELARSRTTDGWLALARRSAT